MGDFAAPAAAANGSSICINNNLTSGLSGAGLGVSGSPHGPPAAAAGNNTASSVPKHSTVVERLRQRIEGCRRHHVSCESRYQQAQAEQLELERRDTVSLYQRTLEQRAKKTGTGGGGSKQQHPSKQQQDAEPPTAEQRNHTLIMVRGCGPGGGGVGVRSLSLAGMGWSSAPELVTEERGSAQLWRWRDAPQLLTGWGGGSGQFIIFFFLRPLRKGELLWGKGEGAVPGVPRAGGRFCVCVRVSPRLLWPPLNPAGEGAGRWLRRLGRRLEENLGRFLLWAAPACSRPAPHAS